MRQSLLFKFIQVEAGPVQKTLLELKVSVKIILAQCMVTAAVLECKISVFSYGCSFFCHESRVKDAINIVESKYVDA